MNEPNAASTPAAAKPTPATAEPKSAEQLEQEAAEAAMTGMAIGRIVWFTARDANMSDAEEMKPIPAIVTRISANKVGALTLTIFPPSRNPVSWDAEHSVVPIPGRWRWPDGAKR